MDFQDRNPTSYKSAISPKESHYLFLSGAVQSNSKSGESYGLVQCRNITKVKRRIIMKKNSPPACHVVPWWEQRKAGEE